MKKYAIFTLLILFFFYGFVSGAKQIFPYKEIKFLYSFIKKNNSNENKFSKIETFKECKIPIIKKFQKTQWQ